MLINFSRSSRHETANPFRSAMAWNCSKNSVVFIILPWHTKFSPSLDSVRDAESGLSQKLLSKDPSSSKDMGVEHQWGSLGIEKSENWGCSSPPDRTQLWSFSAISEVTKQDADKIGSSSDVDASEPDNSPILDVEELEKVRFGAIKPNLWCFFFVFSALGSCRRNRLSFSDECTTAETLSSEFFSASTNSATAFCFTESSLLLLLVFEMSEANRKPFSSQRRAWVRVRLSRITTPSPCSSVCSHKQSRLLLPKNCFEYKTVNCSLAKMSWRAISFIVSFPSLR